MALHIESFGAQNTRVEVVPRGTEIGVDVVGEEAALVLSENEAVVVEGSIAQLRALLTAGLRALDDVAPPAAARE